MACECSDTSGVFLPLQYLCCYTRCVAGGEKRREDSEGDDSELRGGGRETMVPTKLYQKQSQKRAVGIHMIVLQAGKIQNE